MTSGLLNLSTADVTGRNSHLKGGLSGKKISGKN